MKTKSYLEAADVAKIAAAACAEASAHNWAVTIAVADDGGHLLHLGKIRELATGMASIGGAGTFDGIVFASVVAAFFA
mgnify:CR=1 FL=1